MPRLKASLHTHTTEDLDDYWIHYSAYELIDEAAKQGFEVLSITCHDIRIFDNKLKKHAEKQNILLIPGIEKEVEHKHILILNVHSSATKISTFADLKAYRAKHPESLIIAPHPFFPASSCLNGKLLKHLDLFDAIEYSFFYTRKLNFNKKAKIIAKKYNLPLVGTGDVHLLETLPLTYSIIKSEKNIPAIIEAIKKGKIYLVTNPLSFSTLFRIGFISIIWEHFKQLFHKR